MKQCIPPSFAEEIKPGLVLHLSPDIMLEGGATHTVPEEFRVRGNHFFICRSVAGNDGRWIPCYSDDGPGRLEIPASARVGHPKWAANDCYFHPAQIWVASHGAIEAAAKAARDMSTTHRRNRIKLHLVEGLPD